MRAVVRDAGRAGEQFEPRTSSNSSAGERGCIRRFYSQICRALLYHAGINFRLFL
jgi:hypothetical protein